MNICDTICTTASTIFIFPYELSNTIAFSKDLIANLSQILNLIIINRDKNHTIL